MILSQVKFDRLVLCEPINKQAYLVTLQSGCDEVYKPVSTEELVEIFARLCRKQRLLKRVLKIETKAQHANTVTRYRKGIRQARDLVGERVMREYVTLSGQIQQVQLELSERRKARRFAHQALMEHKQMASGGTK